MDIIRRFILDRGGVGEFTFEHLKKFASCFYGIELDDEEIIKLLRSFRREGIKIEVEGKKFRVYVENPDKLLRAILERNAGRTLREALEEFRKIFGDFEERRLLMLFRAMYDIGVEKEGIVQPLASITNLSKRLDGKIVTLE